MIKVFLIEDDKNLGYMMADGLEDNEFSTVHFLKAEDALIAFPEKKPDLIITDVNLLGEIDGFDFAKRIRTISNIPIIFITARTQVRDIKKGYEVGNVDYLKKPFGISELLLRMNELLSHTPTYMTTHGFEWIGSYQFFHDVQILKIGDKEFHLNPAETKILGILNSLKDQVVEKSIFTGKDDMSEGTFYNTIGTLREKLSYDDKILIESFPRVGYRLTVLKN